MKLLIGLLITLFSFSAEAKKYYTVEIEVSTKTPYLDGIKGLKEKTFEAAQQSCLIFEGFKCAQVLILEESYSQTVQSCKCHISQFRNVGGLEVLLTFDVEYINKNVDQILALIIENNEKIYTYPFKNLINEIGYFIIPKLLEQGIETFKEDPTFSDIGIAFIVRTIKLTKEYHELMILEVKYYYDIIEKLGLKSSILEVLKTKF